MSRILLTGLIAVIAINCEAFGEISEKLMQDLDISDECKSEIYDAIKDCNDGYVHRAIDNLNELKRVTCRFAADTCSYLVARIYFELNKYQKADEEIKQIIGRVDKFPREVQVELLYMAIECGDKKALDELTAGLKRLDYAVPEVIRLYLRAKYDALSGNYSEASKLYNQAYSATSNKQVMRNAELHQVIADLLGGNEKTNDFEEKLERILKHTREYPKKDLIKLGFALEDAGEEASSTKVWEYFKDEGGTYFVRNTNGIRSGYKNDAGAGSPQLLPKFIIKDRETLAEDIKRLIAMTPSGIYRSLKYYDSKQIWVLAYYIGRTYQNDENGLEEMLEIDYPRRFQVYLLKGFLQDLAITSIVTNSPREMELMIVGLRNISNQRTLDILRRKLDEKDNCLEVKMLLKSYFRSQADREVQTEPTVAAKASPF